MIWKRLLWTWIVVLSVIGMAMILGGCSYLTPGVAAVSGPSVDIEEKAKQPTTYPTKVRRRSYSIDVTYPATQAEKGGKDQ